MGDRYTEISPKLQAFIERQKIFFVGTAASDGRVNVSPKGMDALRVLGPNRVVWLNVTGSGNETAAHISQNNRMTLMFCSFEREPLILRLYGHARAIYPGQSAWDPYIELFPPFVGARQIFEMEIDLVQTSCGFGVPFFDYVGEREALQKWAEQEGEEKLAEYREEYNRVSIDGVPIPMPESASS